MRKPTEGMWSSWVGAGLACAKGLGGSAFRVTLVDRWNLHLFQPLLYQVATGDPDGAVHREDDP
jgi:NADH dehydrogenase FAD-containing subunit